MTTATDHQRAGRLMAEARADAREIVRVGLKDVTDYLEMAQLVVAKPIEWCPSKSPKGHYVCIRYPHPDNENHVYKAKKRRDG